MNTFKELRESSGTVNPPVYFRQKDTPKGNKARDILDDAGIAYKTTTEQEHPFYGTPPSATNLFGETRDFTRHAHRESHPSILVSNHFYSGIEEISLFTDLHQTICDVEHFIATKQYVLNSDNIDESYLQANLQMKPSEFESVINLAVSNALILPPDQLSLNKPLMRKRPDLPDSEFIDSPTIIDIASLVRATYERAGYRFAYGFHPIALLEEEAMKHLQDVRVHRSVGIEDIRLVDLKRGLEKIMYQNNPTHSSSHEVYTGAIEYTIWLKTSGEYPGDDERPSY